MREPPRMPITHGVRKCEPVLEVELTRDEQQNDAKTSLIVASSSPGGNQNADNTHSSGRNLQQRRFLRSISELLDDSSLIAADSSIGNITGNCDEAQQPSLRIFEAFESLSDFEVLVLDTSLVLPQTLNREDFLVVGHEI